MSKLVLSASRIKTFLGCSRKYYYTYIEKLPRKEWKHFVLGSLVHNTLELFHKQYTKDDSSINVKQLMKKCFYESTNSQIDHSVLTEAYNILKGYLDLIEYVGLKAEVVSVEENFNIELNEDFSIQGFVDRVDKDDDGVFHIKDYKTSKSAKYMDDFQLKTYGIFLLNKFNIDKFRASYIMLKLNNKLLSYDFNKLDVEKCKKDIIEYGERIMVEQKWPLSVSKLCDYCDFQSVCWNTW